MLMYLVRDNFFDGFGFNYIFGKDQYHKVMLWVYVFSDGLEA